MLAAVAPADDAAAAALAGQFDRLDALLRRPPLGTSTATTTQIVSFGEIWSTVIVSAALTQAAFAEHLARCAHVVCTDDTHRSARIDWVSAEPHAAAAWAGVRAQPETPGHAGLHRRRS